MELLAKPWNGLIIAALEPGPARFSDLQERLGTIADRILSERLKELQAARLLLRRVLPGPPVRVEYELNAAGHGFREVYDAIARWGQMLGTQEAVKESAVAVRRRPQTDRPRSKK